MSPAATMSCNSCLVQAPSCTHAGEQHMLTHAGAPKAIPLPPVVTPPLVPSHSEHSVVQSSPNTVCASQTDDASKDVAAEGSCTAARHFIDSGEYVSVAEPLKKLPGLVARPLTLQQAVAEAITEAAYRQGSNDNLATVVVDLRGAQRFAAGSMAWSRSSSAALEGQLEDARVVEVPALTPEASAMISVPRRSTVPATTSLTEEQGVLLQIDIFLAANLMIMFLLSAGRMFLAPVSDQAADAHVTVTSPSLLCSCTPTVCAEGTCSTCAAESW